MSCGHLALAAWGVILLSQLTPIRADANLSILPGGYDIKVDDSNKSKLTLTKLHSIIIPKVDFDKFDIAHVIEFVTIKSKELDPDHAGVKFRLLLPPKSLHIHRMVSITLEDTPLYDVLPYVCVQTDLSYKIIQGVVVLSPGHIIIPPSSSEILIRH